MKKMAIIFLSFAALGYIFCPSSIAQITDSRNQNKRDVKALVNLSIKEIISRYPGDVKNIISALGKPQFIEEEEEYWPLYDPETPYQYRQEVRAVRFKYEFPNGHRKHLLLVQIDNSLLDHPFVWTKENHLKYRHYFFHSLEYRILFLSDYRLVCISNFPIRFDEWTNALFTKNVRPFWWYADLDQLQERLEIHKLPTKTREP